MQDKTNVPMMNTGGRASAHDYRADIVASDLAATGAVMVLPAALETDFWDKFGYILMQNQTPACVSHMVANMMRLWYYTKTGELVDFCPRFLHILSGMPEHNGGWQAGPEDGRDPATVLKIAMTIGCCTIKTLDNNTLLSNADYMDPSAIPNTAISEAQNYKIPGYAPVAINQQAIRTGISQSGIVGMVIEMSNVFWTDANGNTSWAVKDIGLLRAPGVTTGGHGIGCMGWNEADLDRWLNCWSPAWADGGKANYVFNEWQNAITEAWQITMVNPTTLATIQGLPAPKEFVHNFSTPLSRGMSGPEVRQLQVALSIDGEATYPEINGIFGPLTQQAVMLFQHKYASDILTPQGLTVPTGNVGPATLAKLNALFNK